MPFISRDQIAPSIRKPHEAEYRQKLREALLDPTLTDEQANRLRSELENIGKPKVYRADSPPPPGAIDI